MLNAMRKNYIHLLETLEEMALATIARIVPWLIPIGPAFMIKTSVETYLQVDPIISILMAAGFEGMGIYTSHVAFLCWSWNKTRTKKDGVAPFDLMRWLVGAYLFIGIVLVVLIKVYPPSTIIAPAFFLPLGLVVYTSWATHIELSGWRNAKEEDRQDKKIRTGIKVEIKQLTTALGELKKQNTQTLTDFDTLRVEFDTLAEMKMTLENELKALERDHRFALKKMVSDRKESPINGVSIEKAHAGKQARIETRHAQIRSLLAQGMTQADMADELGVSLSTIKRDVALLTNGEVSK